jgi:hypothetical protein
MRRHALIVMTLPALLLILSEIVAVLHWKVLLAHAAKLNAECEAWYLQSE